MTEPFEQVNLMKAGLFAYDRAQCVKRSNELRCPPGYSDHRVKCQAYKDIVLFTKTLQTLEKQTANLEDLYVARGARRDSPCKISRNEHADDLLSKFYEWKICYLNNMLQRMEDLAKRGHSIIEFGEDISGMSKAMDLFVSEGDKYFSTSHRYDGLLVCLKVPEKK